MMFVVVMVKHDYFELKCVLALMTFSALSWTLFNLNGLSNGYDKNNGFHIESWTTANDTDTLIHSQICYIYLLTAIDLNFLFDRSTLSDPDQML
jgi:hypothetical protein